MHVAISHALPDAEAAQRLRGCLDGLKDAHPEHIAEVRQDWNGASADLVFVMRSPSLQIAGTLLTEPGRVTIQARLPFIVWPFKHAIENMIREHVGKCLG